MSKDKKTSWFNVDGNFETRTPMTSTELSDILDQVDEVYGLYFGGTIKPIFDRDSE